MLTKELIEAIAERNVHVRDMLELKHIADRHGLTSTRVDAKLDEWCNEWLERNPRQAELLIARYTDVENWFTKADAVEAYAKENGLR